MFAKRKVMGLLNKLFGTNKKPEKEKKIIPWHRLVSVKQLPIIEKESFSKPIVIFKFSSRCGTSSMALRQFERQFAIEDEKVKLYFLDLIVHREVSDEVAIRFQVMHQSPQMLIIRNNNAIYHASHYGINAEVLDQLV